MNKAQLKKLIKPVVKECIQEVLIEEGLLTEVVSQVAEGMSNKQIAKYFLFISPFLSCFCM